MKKKRSTISKGRKNKNLPDRDIDFSDIPESTDKELKKAKRVGLKRSNKRKKALYIHSPAPIKLETFKSILGDAILEGDIRILKDLILSQILLHKNFKLMTKRKFNGQKLYDLFDGKREFNPTVKTLSSLLKAIAA